ncbi:hypothetical protein [Sulfurisoma sediminicola]|uniref:Uncharacterized protein n=1 Tax=Sulfurisoma sediminicola TaxID=1381557 RepID=A0A497XCF0_9PROT|nr:hypothetical protein [Sulfurisoma sediminicola]RLJ64591.1 hypothetical protein DFR35_1232 [Sulfurisoma sediminicola]
MDDYMQFLLNKHREFILAAACTDGPMNRDYLVLIEVIEEVIRGEAGL